MKLSIISGSQRANSQSLRTANYLQKLSETHFTESHILDLHQADLPFWNEGFWKDSDEWQVWKPIAKQLQESEGLIFISPEWNGMATPAIKNFLMLCSSKELGHKPVLLVSVSASINGVYPISELRLTGSKNNHACFLPDHLIFRNIEQLLDDNLLCQDEKFSERCQYTIELLAEYAKALTPVRKKMATAGQSFPYGM